MVEARRSAEVKEERYDLFSSLLDANEGELDSTAKLSNSALIDALVRSFVPPFDRVVMLSFSRERLPVPRRRL